MATPYAPADGHYILKTADLVNLPNGVVLDVGNGLSLTDGIGTITLDVTGNLDSLANMALGTSGLMRYNAGTLATTACQLVSTGGTLSITNPTGVGGNPDFAVVNNTSTQRVIVAEDGTTKSTRQLLNFISGTGATVTVADNGGSGRADITISATGGGGGGAPATATYILQSVNVDLPNAQSLSALGTGLVLNTAAPGAGILSIATPGTDYFDSSSVIPVANGGTGRDMDPVTDGDMLVGVTADNNFNILPAGADGKVLAMVAGAPTWSDPAGGPIIPTSAGGTGSAIVAPGDGTMLVADAGVFTPVGIGGVYDVWSIDINTSLPMWVPQINGITAVPLGQSSYVVNLVGVTSGAYILATKCGYNTADDYGLVVNILPGVPANDFFTIQLSGVVTNVSGLQVVWKCLQLTP